MYTGDFPGDEPQKMQIVVGGFLESVEFPAPTLSIEGALEAPLEAIITQKQKLGERETKIVYLERNSEGNNESKQHWEIF